MAAAFTCHGNTKSSGTCISYQTRWRAARCTSSFLQWVLEKKVSVATKASGFKGNIGEKARWGLGNLLRRVPTRQTQSAGSHQEVRWLHFKAKTERVATEEMSTWLYQINDFFINYWQQRFGKAVWPAWPFLSFYYCIHWQQFGFVSNPSLTWNRCFWLRKAQD